MNRPTRDLPTPRQALFLGLFGLPFVGVGVALAMAAAGVMFDFGEMYAPRWVGSVGGLLFLLPGIFILHVAIVTLAASAETATRAIKAAVGLLVILELNGFAAMMWGLVLFGDSASMGGGLTGTATESMIVGAVLAVILSLIAVPLGLLYVVGRVMAVVSFVRRKFRGTRP